MHTPENVKIIAIIGPESTGKSTLSEALAQKLETVWVPEYARQYLNQIHRPYCQTDLLNIAKGQIALEDNALQQANQFLICDTNLYVIQVWSEHRYDSCDPWILDTISKRHYDHYLLTDIDLPWMSDPLREHPELEKRKYFYDQYHDIVKKSGVSWTKISGNSVTRLQTAYTALKKL